MIAKRGTVADVILALAAYRDGEFFPCGTAFFIGQHLALTATHVVTNPFDARISFVEPGFSLVAFEQVAGLQDARCWYVETAYFAPTHSDRGDDDRPIDISVLKLSPVVSNEGSEKSPRNWHVELNVFPPEAGETITAYGFAKAEMYSTDEPDLFLYGSNKSIVRAQVGEEFFPRRDRGMYYFPCFEVLGDFPSGMSGGPIFNGNNQVCGVVAGGGIPGISYGSSIWPIFNSNVDGVRFIDLARAGTVRVANHDAVYLDDYGEALVKLTLNPLR
ncbi:trypsin-like serine peptidase [Salinisphaera shabanensis]|uniref:trypsin-like serine peptidase n=1 Tax=Salinisphaera shabanensis TaxID=180542 RepID=UPI000A02A7DA|nr:trypsin-like peptidase domain-containing protein [Salinisphaera shabanensis]